ncbi:MAG: hypothetical protein V4624_02440 [Pseudomonadota bacterium]
MQFFMCCAIIRYHDIKNCDFAIIESKIDDAQSFFLEINRSPYIKYFNKLISLSSHGAILDICELEDYSNFYFEDDRASFFWIQSSVKKISNKSYFYVFEEGIGSYLSSYRRDMGFLRKLKWYIYSRVFGLSLDFGGSSLTTKIYLQHPSLYNKLNPKLEHKSCYSGLLISVILEENYYWDSYLERALNLSGALNGFNKKAALLLGTWEGFGSDFECFDSENYDLIFYKKHPHCVNQDNKPDSFPAGVSVINASWVPAEAIAIFIKTKCTEMDVYHFSSSISLYLENYHGINFIDLANHARFREIMNEKIKLDFIHNAV